VSAPTQAFDGLAREYDDRFSDTAVGRALRRRVWDRLEPLVTTGSTVLDLGCGSGEDTAHLAGLGARIVAVDASPRMVGVARAKLAEWPDRACVLEADIEQLDRHPECDGPFDLVLSNLGALNCVGDLASVLEAIRDRLHGGGALVACLMGPTVPWEWLWMVAHGRPAEAVRRWRRGGVRWRGVTVHYPSIRRFRRLAPSGLEVRRISGLGFVLPPTYAARRVNRWPVVVRTLDALERAVERVPPMPRIADHYVVELERTP
jgi:SAM-dependent methyltransferase